MQHCDSLIAASWCIPVEPPGSVLEDHAVAIVDGRIAAVLPIDKARETYQPSVFVQRPGHLLIPGLVNAHVHAAMTLFRGIADDLPLEAWLKNRVWPVERHFASAEFVRDGTELASESPTIARYAGAYDAPEASELEQWQTRIASENERLDALMEDGIRETQSLLDALDAIDPDNLSPREALDALAQAIAPAWLPIVSRDGRQNSSPLSKTRPFTYVRQQQLQTQLSGQRFAGSGNGQRVLSRP